VADPLIAFLPLICTAASLVSLAFSAQPQAIICYRECCSSVNFLHASLTIMTHGSTKCEANISPS